MIQSDSPTALKQSFEQFVVFSLDDEEYAVPVLSVAEVVPKLEITPFPDAPDYIVGLANLRGKILPILDLEKKFNLNATSETHKHIMVAESEEEVQFGILVDQVKEVIKIPSSSIQPSPEMLKAKIGAEYLPGVIILEDKDQKVGEARMLLILDISKILSHKHIAQLHALAQTAKNPTIKELVNKEAS